MCHTFNGPSPESRDASDVPVSVIMVLARGHVGTAGPRSGSILARLVILDACVPRPGRSLLESGGLPDWPGSADDFGLGSGKSFPSYGAALLKRDSWDAIEDKHEVFFRESGASLSPFDFTSGMDMETEYTGQGRTCWTLLVTLVRARRDPFRAREET